MFTSLLDIVDRCWNNGFPRNRPAASTIHQELEIIRRDFVDKLEMVRSAGLEEGDEEGLLSVDLNVMLPFEKESSLGY